MSNIINLFHRRIVNTLKYSFSGFKRIIISEEAFRIEFILFLILFPLAFFIGQNTIEKILLVVPLFLVLIVEILNTCVEILVDKFGKEKTDSSKLAKDLGSLAVSFSLFLVIVIWSLIIFN